MLRRTKDREVLSKVYGEYHKYSEIVEELRGKNHAELLEQLQETNHSLEKLMPHIDEHNTKLLKEYMYLHKKILTILALLGKSPVKTNQSRELSGQRAEHRNMISIPKLVAVAEQQKLLREQRQKEELEKSLFKELEQLGGKKSSRNRSRSRSRTGRGSGRK